MKWISEIITTIVEAGAAIISLICSIVMAICTLGISFSRPHPFSKTTPAAGKAEKRAARMKKRPSSNGLGLLRRAGIAGWSEPL